MQSWLTIVVGTVGALLPIANPLSTAPVFTALTHSFSAAERARQARQAAFYMATVLLVCLSAGALILTFFGITLPVLRMAGGFIVARVGFGMLGAKPGASGAADAHECAVAQPDVSFTPIALPLLSGPGSMAVTIGMATNVHHAGEYLAVAAGIVVVALLAWVVLRSSGEVDRLLGPTGMDAMGRVMGFLLVCIGFQFAATGVLEGITNERVMQSIVSAYEAAVAR